MTRFVGSSVRRFVGSSVRRIDIEFGDLVLRFHLAGLATVLAEKLNET
jgi:hypothetical protein